MLDASSRPAISSATTSMTSSSGTSRPASKHSRACSPRSVPRLTASRSASPADRCPRPNCSPSRSPWVPLPEPGGPIRTTSGGPSLASSRGARADPTLVSLRVMSPPDRGAPCGEGNDAPMASRCPARHDHVNSRGGNLTKQPRQPSPASLGLAAAGDPRHRATYAPAHGSHRDGQPGGQGDRPRRRVRVVPHRGGDGQRPDRVGERAPLRRHAGLAPPHAVHRRGLRGRLPPPPGGVPAPRVVRRRPRRRARPPRRALGTAGRVGSVRHPADRLRRGARRDPSRVHGAARRSTRGLPPCHRWMSTVGSAVPGGRGDG